MIIVIVIVRMIMIIIRVIVIIINDSNNQTIMIMIIAPKDSKPKKRLRENRAITHIEDNHTRGTVLPCFLGVSSGEWVDRVLRRY